MKQAISTALKQYNKDRGWKRRKYGNHPAMIDLQNFHDELQSEDLTEDLTEEQKVKLVTIFIQTKPVSKGTASYKAWLTILKALFPEKITNTTSAKLAHNALCADLEGKALNFQEINIFIDALDFSNTTDRSSIFSCFSGSTDDRGSLSAINSLFFKPSSTESSTFNSTTANDALAPTENKRPVIFFEFIKGYDWEINGNIDHLRRSMAIFSFPENTTTLAELDEIKKHLDNEPHFNDVLALFDADAIKAIIHQHLKLAIDLDLWKPDTDFIALCNELLIDFPTNQVEIAIGANEYVANTFIDHWANSPEAALHLLEKVNLWYGNSETTPKSIIKNLAVKFESSVSVFKGQPDGFKTRIATEYLTANKLLPAYQVAPEIALEKIKACTKEELITLLTRDLIETINATPETDATSTNYADLKHALCLRCFQSLKEANTKDKLTLLLSCTKSNPDLIDLLAEAKKQFVLSSSEIDAIAMSIASLPNIATTDVLRLAASPFKPSDAELQTKLIEAFDVHAFLNTIELSTFDHHRLEKATEKSKSKFSMSPKKGNDITGTDKNNLETDFKVFIDKTPTLFLAKIAEYLRAIKNPQAESQPQFIKDLTATAFTAKLDRILTLADYVEGKLPRESLLNHLS